jgi:hypothetical protein
LKIKLKSPLFGTSIKKPPFNLRIIFSASINIIIYFLNISPIYLICILLHTLIFNNFNIEIIDAKRLKCLILVNFINILESYREFRGKSREDN